MSISVSVHRHVQEVFQKEAGNTASLMESEEEVRYV